MTSAQYLLQQAQWMVEAENRMNNIENDVAQTSQSIGNMKGIKPNTYNSSVMGRKATKVCRTRGLLTGTVVDSKYGLINTYPLEVLDEIFFG